MKKVILAGAISTLTAVSVQADYQFEANAGYIQGDGEVSGFSDFDFDFDGYVAAATIYFGSVDTSNGPLGEAAFLDKASGISVAFTTTEDDDSDEETDTKLVSGRFVFGSDFIIEASFIDGESDETISFGFGKYLSDSSDLVFSYSDNLDEDVSSLNLAFHSVNDLNGAATLAYDLGVNYVDAFGETGFGLNGGVTYYPVNQLGLGAALTYTSIDDEDTTGIAVDAEYFFNENIAGALSYSTEDNDFITVNIITLGVTARF